MADDFNSGNILNVPSVSIIMVSYNSMPFVEGIFNSLKNQTYQNYEVIIYDNGSNDGSIDYIRTKYPCYKLIELGHNTGFSYPNNLGVKATKSRYILALNFDIVLENTFLENLVEAINLRDDIGWVAPKMCKLVNGEKTDNFDCFGHHMRKWRCATSYDPKLPFDPKIYTTREEVFGASACAALYKREMLDDIAINGEIFDEDFFAYYEDVDLDWRAQKAGWKCLFVPEAIGYHARGGSGLSKNLDIIKIQISNRLLSIVKNDYISLFIQDVKAIYEETIKQIKPLKEKNGSILIAIILRTLKYIPLMIKKRIIFRRKIRVTKEYIRGIIY